MPLLTILNLPGASVEVPPAHTLLQALQGAGFDWMHACGAKGRCTTCRLQVVEGMENLAPYTPAELRYRATGRLHADERLTCQTQLPAGPVQARVPEATQLPHIQYNEQSDSTK